ncbi:AhpC/TSA family protein [Flavobacterium agricola]|uniref:AhpC/TSA family protein n=1 Tax=Flavobacterium agricola TaxID=2870839 RepID=A0ABY6LY83_9FLAO|nr:TlpA disulfide reductase family protein [Flavobacterium agricola]UYW01199.1 AhpC/TSA family protein [Flavobacterium agricola]
MKNIFLSVFILFMLFSCSKSSNTFKIEGVLKNVADDNIIYAVVDEVIVDSSIISNGKFSISGETVMPQNVWLILNDYDDYASIWVDNKSTTYFEAEPGNFRYANIKGSQIQSEYEILLEHLRKPYEDWDQISSLFNETLSEEELNEYKKMEAENDEQVYKACLSFITKYPDSFISSHIINGYSTTWGIKKTTSAFNLLTKYNRNSHNGKKVAKFLELNQSFNLGDKYVDFEMNNINNQKIKLSDVHKKITLLEFWASNCEPCRIENPNLVEVYKKFQKKGFNILGVSLDKNVTNWKKQLTKMGYYGSKYAILMPAMMPSLYMALLEFLQTF